MGRRSILGCARGARLSKTMSRALQQAGFVAPISEPIAEARGRKRPTLFGHEKRQLTAWAGIDRRLERGQHRQFDSDTGFALGKPEPTISHVLPAELHHVRTANPSVDEKIEGQSCLSAQRMARLELGLIV
jgi:hypothetical protein